MRIITRCFGLGVILMLSVMLFSQMMSFNIRYDELTNCISTAMTNTQIVMQEQIEDQIYQTNNKRQSIDSNDAYVDIFAQNFYKLVTTDSDFKIRVYGVDYEKGFLDIGVESSFKMFNGQTKTIYSRKTSLVDIINE